MGIFNFLKKKASDNKYLQTMVNRWDAGREVLPRGNMQARIDAFRHWVYICADKNAKAVMSVPLRLYVAKKSKTKTLARTKVVNKEQRDWVYEKGDLWTKKAVEVEEVLEHPFLDLMKNINPYQNKSDFIYLTDIFEELTGNSYWYIVKDGLGIPRELFIIPSQNMNPIPGGELIKGYRFRKGTQTIDYDENEIIHFKFPSPTNIWHGFSPLSAVANAYNIRENMDTYENALFSNMCRPEMIMYTEKRLTDDTRKRYAEQFRQEYTGVKKGGKVMFIENIFKPEKISFSPKEIAFIMGRQITKEEIVNAYGCSVALFDKDTNRANIDGAIYLHQKDTISPRHRFLEEKMNEKLLPLYDEKLFVLFDNCVPADKEFALKKNTDYVDKGIYTRNEVRQMEGKEIIDGLDEIYLPMNLVPIGGSERQIEEMAQKTALRVKEILKK